jgi:hypothetical protein
MIFWGFAVLVFEAVIGFVGWMGKQNTAFREIKSTAYFTSP